MIFLAEAQRCHMDASGSGSKFNPDSLYYSSNPTTHVITNPKAVASTAAMQAKTKFCIVPPRKIGSVMNEQDAVA